MRHQQTGASDEAAYYLVRVLTQFANADRLFEVNREGRRMRPLAMLLQEALEGSSVRERQAMFQYLGDLALFIAGVFADSLNRRLVDIDYYIAMGGNAYGHLAESMRGSRAGQSMREVFVELAERFTDFVDVLNEVGEGARQTRDFDLLRLYEVWLRTGSQRAERQLRSLGIHPGCAPRSMLRH